MAVHPHGCGEHSNSPLHRLFNNGSSPRMWGTHTLPKSPPDELRFIPTDVGNTGWGPIYRRRISVHPHGCGEHLISAVGVSLWLGSSPRMWGTLSLNPTLTRLLRFIPTDVGNTLATASRSEA